MKSPQKKNNEGFFDRVYDVVRLIPFGKVTSYGAIAKFIGSPQASRMVGWAMNNAHSQKDFIPAHRVVNRNGMLTGKMHFGSANIMEELLKNEGITVINDKIIDLKNHFWDPNTDLENSYKD